MGSLTVRAATANIQRTLTEQQVTSDIKGVATLNAVTGWQEFHTKHHRQTLRELPGLGQYIPKRAAGAVPISWPKEDYAIVARGSIRVHRGLVGVSPARYINYVVLMHRRTRYRFWFINTHTVSGVDGGGKYPRRWRRKRWNKHMRMLGDLVATLTRKYGKDGLIVGDFNKSRVKVLGDEFHYDVQGTTHDSGRQLDYMIRPEHPGLDHRETVTHELFSDHDVVFGRYRFKPVTGTPSGKVMKTLRRRGVRVLTRRQWGTKHEDVYQWRRQHKPARQPADTVVQHITVTLDHGPLTGDFKTDMQTIERIGMERFGSGVSYNWVVDMTTGMIGQGQSLDAKGSHTVNNKRVSGYSYDQNYAARAIAVLGMPDYRLSKKAAQNICELLIAMMETGAITNHFDYDPHSKFAYKDCPCDETRDRMALIYANAQKLVLR